jgi:hypothetical protein
MGNREAYIKRELRICTFQKNVIRRLKWARPVARMGEFRNEYKTLNRTPEKNRPL